MRRNAGQKHKKKQKNKLGEKRKTRDKGKTKGDFKNIRIENKKSKGKTKMT